MAGVGRSGYGGFGRYGGYGGLGRYGGYGGFGRYGGYGGFGRYGYGGYGGYGGWGYPWGLYGDLFPFLGYSYLDPYGYGDYAGSYPDYSYVDSYYPSAEADYGVPYATQPVGSDSTAYGSNDTGTTLPYYASPAIGSEGNEETLESSPSGEQFFSQARAAFEQGDYRKAAKLDAHALIEMPRNVEAHELMSLALFAQSDYRGAAMEARIAIVLGPVAEWSTLYAYYNSVPTYEKQLKALTSYVAKNPSMTDARFLLAYHNLMMGHTTEAKELLTQETAKAPNDKVAAGLLKQLESGTGKAGSLTAAKAGTSRQ